MAEFMTRSALHALSEDEWEALYAVQVATTTMYAEWRCADVLASRLMRAHDIAEARWESLPYQHPAQGLDELLSSAWDTERKAGDLACRYATTAVVLGVTLL